MLEPAADDATAFALDRRNFDYLPDEQAARWRRAFLSTWTEQVPSPRKLIIELLNSCNLDCPICRVGQHGVNLARAMPHQVFESLLESVSGLQSIRLNGLGESTLLPNFSIYVEALTRHGLGIELITNGSGTLHDYRQVIAHGGHILVSWDAAQPAIFEQLRRPARWSDYIASLEQIAKTASAASGGGKCSLIFTLQRHNVGEVTGVVDLAARLGITAVQVNVAKTPTSNWSSHLLGEITRDLASAAEHARAGGVMLFVPDQIGGTRLALAGTTPTASSRCAAPWHEAVIRWNGDVQACNMFNPFTYGNVYRTPLPVIWQNRFAGLFRARLNGTDRHPYCVGCTYMPSAFE
jgi:radical SAM protein with 4Fe4S-binding SPASM domain